MKLLSFLAACLTRRLPVLVAVLALAAALSLILAPEAHAAGDQDVPADSPGPVPSMTLAPEGDALAAEVNGGSAGPHLRLNQDIPWSEAFHSLDDVERAYNNGRSQENSQLSVFVKPIDFPPQATWDKMDSGQKVLWIVNQERTARGAPPLQGLEKNVTEVAQAYAEWLLANNAWGHEADGKDPYVRIHSKPDIAACHDVLAVSENLAFAGTTRSDGVPFPVEYLVYKWIYDDASSNWGHRKMILWPSYKDNSGETGKEGFVGVGHARGSYVDPEEGDTYPNTDMLVMNVFDPCATWSAKPEPKVPAPPPPKPVPPPVPKPNTSAVSGKTRIPTWVTIDYQPFERNTWPGKWTLSDNNGAKGGEYMWVAAPCRVFEGEFSGMAVGGGQQGLQTGCGDNYPNDARSWMIYGPFSLADAVAAELRLKAWVYTEADNDMLCLLASLDRKEFNGPCVSGFSDGWVDETLDLNRVYRFGSVLGQPKVYVALAFVTNSTETRPHQGAYVDNVLLRKGVLAAATSASDDAAKQTLYGVRITDEKGNTVMTDRNGNFSLAGLSRGVHTLTPHREGYQFYPPQVTVDLSGGDATGFSFVGSTSIYQELHLPAVLDDRISAATGAAGATAADLAATEATFILDCDSAGCTLNGPLDHAQPGSAPVRP